ncbi:PilZ domain-containing protein [Neobacillus sp. Marseille-QA0830]
MVILAGVAGVILVISIIYAMNAKKTEKRTEAKPEPKPVNRRDNFRVRVNLQNSVMEVLQVGANNLQEFDECEVKDISVGGVGLVSYYDLPLQQQVFVKLHFYLNGEAFTLDGRIVRKIERINRSSFFYGVELLNLSNKDEERLLKEIVALENRRRKTAIK